MNYIQAWWQVEVGRFLVEFCIIGAVVFAFALLFAVVYIGAAIKTMIRNMMNKGANPHD